MQQIDVRNRFVSSPVLMVFELSELITERAMSAACDKIVGWLKRGSTPLVILSPGRGFLTSLMKETLHLNRKESQTPFGRRETEVLGFCAGTMRAAILSQKLKARGHDAIALTGFQAGLFSHNGSGEILMCADERIACHLKKPRVIIISGLHGIDEMGELVTPGGGDPSCFVNYLAARFNAHVISRQTGAEGAPEPEFSVVPADIEDSALPLENKVVDMFGARHKPLEQERVFTGILVVSDINEFKIDFPSTAQADHARLRILRSLGEQRISLDMINICYDSLYFIVRRKFLPQVMAILSSEDISFTHRPELVKLSITGMAMKGTPGVMAKIYGALESAGAEVMRTTDSHITISCLIKEESLDAALEALMNACGIARHEIVYENKAR